MKLSILRLTDLAWPVTLGVLCFDGLPFYTTLELPWKDNQPRVSCIPEGSYMARKTFRRTLNSGSVIPVTIEVTAVPGRSGILVHKGNVMEDTQGCILLGYGFLPSIPGGVTYSARAMASFEADLKKLPNDTDIPLDVIRVNPAR